VAKRRGNIKISSIISPTHETRVCFSTCSFAERAPNDPFIGYVALLARPSLKPWLIKRVLQSVVLPKKNSEHRRRKRVLGEQQQQQQLHHRRTSNNNRLLLELEEEEEQDEDSK
jgi:hypothetical protein